MIAEVRALPVGNVQDVAGGLRRLAEDIEAGRFDAAHVVAYVVDCGDGRVEAGLLGGSPEPGAVAHFMFGCGMRKLEAVSS